MAYVDGFLLVVPKKNLAAYRKIAKQAGKIWRKYGALDYKECVGDDVNVKGVLPFPTLLKLKSSEVVVFSYIAYKSKAHRNQVNAKVMKDPYMNQSFDNMPFDMKRMSYGGFKVVVDE